MWACPHCRQPLQASPEGTALVCANGHSFDRAREGYVNLLPSHHKGSREPGDSAAMMAARRRIHEAGTYRPLAEALVGQLAALPGLATILDLGCGEGYYTGAMTRALPAARFCAVDISRAAVKLAAKGCKSASFAVASAFRLPLADASLDAVVRVFAPSDDAELARVLTARGYYLEVTPAPRHLWQLRAALYDNPREHPPARLAIAGMTMTAQAGLDYELTPAPALVGDIVAMTPFAHRSPGERRERLRRSGLACLSMRFSLHLFQREQ